MTRHIVLAEDEDSIATSLSFLLSRAGFSVTVERDGHAALRTVLADPPTAMILDVMLPGLDGYEILDQVRARHSGADLPVVMLTASAQQEDRNTALTRGADLFIAKPFSNAELVSAVTGLIDARAT